METMASVAAVIVTRNRCAILSECLGRLLEQTTQPNEILVVDDCSDDATGTLVKELFPEVRYMRLGQRKGYIHARNLGVASAASEWVLFLDDDSWFAEQDGLAKAVRHTEQLPEAGVLAFNIAGPSGKLLWQPEKAPYSTASHIGCGAMVRRRAFETVGGYMEPFYYMGEEEELSLRMLDAGWKTVALPGVVVYHAQSPKNRSWPRIRYFGHRNAVLREMLRCPARYLPCYFIGTWLSNSVYNIRKKMLLTDFKVLADVPWMLGVMLEHRRAVMPHCYQEWRRLRKATDQRETPPSH